MKNLAKLFSILFLSTGMLLVSCSKDEKKDTPTPTPTPTPIVKDGITVKFGDKTWTAGYIDNLDATSMGYPVLDFYFGEVSGTDFPIVQFIANTSGKTTYTGAQSQFDYYEETMLVNADKTKYFGDWWAESGTVTITKYENSKVSATADVVMVSASDKYVDKIETPRKRTLKITLTNVDVAMMAAVSQRIQDLNGGNMATRDVKGLHRVK